MTGCAPPRLHHEAELATDARTLALQVDPALRGILLPFLQSLASRTKQAADLAAFTGELAEIVERAVAAGPLASSGAAGGHHQHSTALSDALVPAAFYELLLNELAALGWDRVVDVDATQRRLTISGADAAGRRHDLR